MEQAGGIADTSALAARRRRARFRAWHRGVREMDLILGPFADAVVPGLGETEFAHLETLLDLPDPDLFAWVNGTADIPESPARPLIHRLIAFHAAAPAHRD